MVVELLRDAGIAAENVQGGMVAYGEYVQPVRVPLSREESMAFEIWQVNRRGKGCLSYVVRAGATAVVVDPSRQVEWYAGFVSRLAARIVHVLDTHVHADHLAGGPALAALAGAPYFVGAGEGFDLRHAIRPLRDGDELHLGGSAGVALRARVVATPGHTPGSTSYLIGQRHLLTGDTMFVGGIGRPDL